MNREKQSMRGAGGSADSSWSLASQAQALPPVRLSDLQQDPPGLTVNVEAFTEKQPMDALRDELIPGEQILSVFDVFFPYGRVPPWKIYFLSVITLGLYYVVAMIRMWCYQNRCCTPRVVEFIRGKMAVTNFGRALCWEQDIYQHKIPDPLGCLMCCFRWCAPNIFAPQVRYSVIRKFESFNLKELREIREDFVTQQPCYCLTLCQRKTASISLTFGGWNTAQLSPFSLRVTTANNFLNRLGLLMGSLGRPMLQGALGIIVQTYPTIHVISETQDYLHRDDTPGTYNEMARMRAALLRALPVGNFEDRFFAGWKDVQMPKMTSTLEGCPLITDNGDVQLHPSLVTLLDGEEILASFGGVYTMSIRDWILSILSFGLYYCLVVRNLRFLRGAYLLTNKRILEIIVHHRSGEIPQHYGRLWIVTRSLFPHVSATAGFFVSDSNCLVDSVDSGMMFGDLALTFTFYAQGSAGVIQNCLNFVKAMSMTTGRAEPLQIGREIFQTKVDAAHLEGVPLHSSEEVVTEYQEMPSYSPCWYHHGHYVCSYDRLGKCFPCVPSILTCGFRPFRATPALIITNSTVFAVQHIQNNPLCWQTQVFGVAWATLRTVAGSELLLATHGHETCCGRLWQGNELGSWCCPMGISLYDMTVRTVDRVGLHVFEAHVGVDSMVPPALVQFRKVVNNVIALVQFEQRAGGVTVAVPV